MLKSLVVFGVLVSLLSGLAEAQQDPPDLEYINAAIESADSMLGAIRIEWKSAIGLSDFSASLDSAKVSERGLYYRKGNKERWEVKAFEGDILRTDDVCTYDGKAGKSLSVLQKEGVVVKTAPRSTQLRTSPLPTRARVWDKPLIDRLRQDAVQLLEERKEIDGVLTYALEGRATEAPDQLLYRVYLDGDKEFMPLQIDIISNAEGVQKVSSQTAYRGYRKEQDLWIPERIEVTGIDTKDGTVFTRNAFQVMEFKMNIESPEELFDLTFPDGTKVHDGIANTDYVVGVSRPSPEAQSIRSYHPLMYGGAAVLLALLVVLLAVRQFKKNR